MVGHDHPGSHSHTVAADPATHRVFFPLPTGPVLRIIDAFGIDRCMWGTDWTRTSGMLTYEEGVAPFRNTDRLSDGDRSKLMGETLKKVYGW